MNSSPRVLIADDQQDVLDALRLLLKSEGFQIETATSPEPKGPPKLMINYIADRDTPDIATIERGDVDPPRRLLRYDGKLAIGVRKLLGVD